MTEQFHVGTDLRVEAIQKEFLKEYQEAHAHLVMAVGKLTENDPHLVELMQRLVSVRFHAKRIAGMADHVAKSIGDHINRPTPRAA